MNYNTVGRELHFIFTSAKMWFPCGIQESFGQCMIDTWHDLRERTTLYDRLMMNRISTAFMHEPQYRRERERELYLSSLVPKMWFPCGIQESLDQYMIDTWHNLREKRTLYDRLMKNRMTTTFMHEPQHRRKSELYFISTSAKNVVSMWDSRSLVQYTVDT